MSNKSKNIGTVAKANIYYKAFILSRLSPCDLQMTHFTPSILPGDRLNCMCLDNSSLCVLNSPTAYVYIDCVVWCGVVELNLLSATTVHNDFLCSKISRDTNYALSLRQYINQLSHHNGSRDIIAILSERILLNANVRERTFRLCIHIVH